MDDYLRKSIILENYSNPVNKGLVDDDSYYKVNMNQESCIDNLDYMIKIEDNVIKDARFDGEACAISTSASSIMISLIINRTVEDALKIIENYENMIDEKPYDEKLLKEACAFNNISMQPNRKKCALLPYDGLKKILENYRRGIK